MIFNNVLYIACQCYYRRRSTLVNYNKRKVDPNQKMPSTFTYIYLFIVSHSINVNMHVKTFQYEQRNV